MKNQRRFLTVFALVAILIGFLRYAGPQYAFAQEQSLHPPYYGETGVNAVFDHEFPVYCRSFPDNCAELEILRDNPRCSTSDERTVGTQVLHYNGRHSRDLFYSGHNGIDFGLNYRHVLAAHSGTVRYAGWFDPANRRNALGLYIDLRATTGLRTDYGHMSALIVETGAAVDQENVIGISGNTGHSTGPHLHFTVRRNGVVVNPYGWQPQNDVIDPWECVNPGTPSQNLWEILPNISNNVYPDGPGIPPPAELDPRLTPDFNNLQHLVIDDNDARFTTFSDPWAVEGCAGLPACYGNTYHFHQRLDTLSGGAIWRIEAYDLEAGNYDVYAFIPHANANTSLAYYLISHNNKYHSAGIDQSVFNQGNFNRNWAYLGRYDFADELQGQMILVYNDGDIPLAERMGADAIVLVSTNGESPPDLVRSIAIGSDDAGPNPSCHFEIDYSEVYLGHCNDGTNIVSGFRYANLDLPAGATITQARIEFTVDGTYEVPLQLRIYGERSPASPTFSNGNRPDQRLLTESSISWIIPTADRWMMMTKRRSPDLGPIVQELVNHPNWVQGQSALTFIVKPDPGFTGNQHRRVMAFERSPAARLLVWYTTGNP